MNLIINPVAFRLGSMSIKWYGILMASGIVIALLMAIVEGKKRQIMPEDFFRFSIVGSTNRLCRCKALLCYF